MYYFWAGNEKKTQKWTWKVCYTPLCSTAFCKKPQKIIALHYYFYYNYKDLKKTYLILLRKNMEHCCTKHKWSWKFALKRNVFTVILAFIKKQTMFFVVMQ